MPWVPVSSPQNSMISATFPMNVSAPSSSKFYRITVGRDVSVSARPFFDTRVPFVVLYMLELNGATLIGVRSDLRLKRATHSVSHGWPMIVAAVHSVVVRLYPAPSVGPALAFVCASLYTTRHSIRSPMRPPAQAVSTI